MRQKDTLLQHIVTTVCVAIPDRGDFLFQFEGVSGHDLGQIRFPKVPIYEIAGLPEVKGSADMTGSIDIKINPMHRLLVGACRGV